jgi:hypothetical protein
MGIAVADQRDREIVESRMAVYNRRKGPRVGDYVDFADGVTHRISYEWPNGYQTSKGGSFYLGGPRTLTEAKEAYVSFSGSLDPTIAPDTLTDTGATRDGWVWIFHHDWWTAGGAVEFSVHFRVFKCSRASDDRPHVPFD